MDLDFDIAKNICEELIPYSLEYYLGVKINQEFEEVDEGLILREKEEEENDFEELDPKKKDDKN